MTDHADLDDEAFEERVEQLEASAAEAFLALSRSSTELYEALVRGRSQQAAANTLGVSRSQLSKLQNREGRPNWKPVGLDTYRRLHRYSPLAGRCVELWAMVKEYRDALDEATRERRLRVLDADVDDMRHEASAGEALSYLRALHTWLGRATPWHPPGGIDAVFAERRVKQVSAPPDPAGREVYQAGGSDGSSRRLVRGDVAWREAIEPSRIAVVLGDAGYGKSWLLRRHARELCTRAIAALESGARVADVDVPIFAHSVDLVRQWGEGHDAVSAIVAASSIACRATGLRIGRNLRAILAERLDPAASNLHVLIDAFDEVVDDNGHHRLTEAVTWLAGLTRPTSGPRLVVTCRPVGFQFPFEAVRVASTRNGPTERTANARFFRLGVLTEGQVRQLWAAWFAGKGRPVPEHRLGRVLEPDSSLRDFVGVPLIAAFCALVAEQQAVDDTRAGLYRQVINALLALRWKVHEPSGYPVPIRQDPGWQARLLQALEQLAWAMATAPGGWREALPVGECERTLSESIGPVTRPVSLCTELVRVHGVLVQLGDAGATDDVWILWMHRSLHEFLAARFLLRLPQEQGEPWTRLWGQPQWQAVLQFALELDQQPGGDPGA